MSQGRGDLRGAPYHFPLERADDRNRGSKVQHEITTSKDVFNMIQEEDFYPLLTYQIYQT